MVRAGRQVAAALLVILAGGPAFAARLEGAGFLLDYDAESWRPLASAPPVLAALLCTAPGCRPGTSLMLLDDPRPLPFPGVAPRSPGALGTGVLPLRAAALVPGRRLLAAGPLAPARIGGRAAARGRFVVEQPDLSRSEMLDTLLPLTGRSLHVSLAGPAIGPEALAAYDRLLAGLALPPPPPARR